MSFFENIYKIEPTSSRELIFEVPEPIFRYNDMLGGMILSRCTIGDKQMSGSNKRAVTADALELALYYLISKGYLKLRQQQYRQTFLGSFNTNSRRLILEHNDAFPQNEQLKSPLLAAIYAAVDGKRRLRAVIKHVLDGYLGANVKHDRPLYVFFSAMLNGEMRGWRLERESTGWGFLRHYAFSCPEEDIDLLTESGQYGRKVLAETVGIAPEFHSVLSVWSQTFFILLKLRKRKEYRHYHHPRRPHGKLPRRRKKRRESDDPRMWDVG